MDFHMYQINDINNFLFIVNYDISKIVVTYSYCIDKIGSQIMLVEDMTLERCNENLLLFSLSTLNNINLKCALAKGFKKMLNSLALFDKLGIKNIQTELWHRFVSDLHIFIKVWILYNEENVVEDCEHCVACTNALLFIFYSLYIKFCCN